MLLLVFIGSCGQQVEQETSPAVGRVTMSDIYRDYPRFRQVAEDFEPDENVIQRLQGTKRGVTCKVFLGTWCSDSEEHVPPFDRLMEAAANPNLSVEYYSVDRDKNDGLGLARRFDIRFVPTFVILEGEREIGRIVETPRVSVGEDLLDILEGGE